MAALVVLAAAAYWSRAYEASDPAGILERAAILRATTREGEYVELGCDTWNPTIMFYADRRGFAMTGDGTFTVVDDPRVCVAGKAGADGPIGMFDE